MAQQKIRIKIRSFDHKVIDEAAKLIIDAAEKTGAILMGPIPLPTDIDRFTVNKSTFVHKNSREQYEMRTHKRLVDITQSTPATIEELSNLSLPSGVDIEIKMIIEGETEPNPSVKKQTTASKPDSSKKSSSTELNEPSTKEKPVAENKTPSPKKKTAPAKKPRKKSPPAKK